MTEETLLRHENNKAHQRAKKELPKGASFEVYFGASLRQPEQPVIVFQHIPKTGGTSLRQIIHRNYVAAGARHMMFGARGQKNPAVMRDWIAGFLESLSARERDSIVCVAAHGANYVMRYLDGPIRAITLIRDPAERIMSQYYYHRRPRHLASRPERSTLKFALSDLYKRKTGKTNVALLHNPQSRSLLEPYFGIEFPELGWSRGAPPDAQLWRERLFALLADKYIVGLQDRFEESVIYFGRECGWTEIFVPHAKVNKIRPREIDEDLRAEILEHNWLDQELYQHFASRPISAGHV